MDLINRSIGISESAESIAKLLTRMCLRSEVCDEGRSVSVEVPPTRAGQHYEQISHCSIAMGGLETGSLRPVFRTLQKCKSTPVMRPPSNLQLAHYVSSKNLNGSNLVGKFGPLVESCFFARCDPSM